MFTGIVEQLAEVAAIETSATGARLKIASQGLENPAIGESIAVNGCCLTLTAQEGGVLSFDLLSETLARTNLGGLAIGTGVNLERALAANGRLGGHFVQGHVDCVSEILDFHKVGADHRLEIALPPEFAAYVVYKGPIAIDGISLTVAEVRADRFSVWIIPHTLEVTNLRGRRAGEQVNLEFDLLAKYVERLVNAQATEIAASGSRGLHVNP